MNEHFYFANNDRVFHLPAPAPGRNVTGTQTGANRVFVHYKLPAIARHRRPPAGVPPNVKKLQLKAMVLLHRVFSCFTQLVESRLCVTYD